MMNDDPIILSEEGRLRQQQILQAALGASRDRKRRTTVVRAAQVSAAVVLIGLILWPVVYSRMSRLTAHDGISVIQTGPRRLPEPTVIQAEPLIIVKRIETDPNILERLALPPIKSTARHISEDELLRELADAHQPAGIISVDGKARLIFR